MKKKLLTVLLASVLSLSMIACGSDKPAASASESLGKTETAESVSENKKADETTSTEETNSEGTASTDETSISVAEYAPTEDTEEYVYLVSCYTYYNSNNEVTGTSRQTYDDHGNPLTYTHTSGDRTDVYKYEYTYGDDGNVKVLSYYGDEPAVETSYFEEYDMNGEYHRTDKDSEGNIVQEQFVSYQPNGSKISTYSNPDGSFSQTTINKYGNLTNSVSYNADGVKTDEQISDEYGISTYTLSTGYTWSADYSDRTEVRHETTYKVTYERDDAGNVIGAVANGVDDSGFTTKISYKIASNHIVEYTDESYGDITRYVSEYDENNNMTLFASYDKDGNLRYKTTYEYIAIPKR